MASVSSPLGSIGQVGIAASLDMQAGQVEADRSRCDADELMGGRRKAGPGERQCGAERT